MRTPTLAGCIVQSLKTRELSPQLAGALLSPDGKRVLRHDETEYWDYKEMLPLDSPQAVASFVKDVLGFHNAQGGLLIIGVSDDFRPVGVTRTRVLDTNRLHQKIRRFVGPDLFLFQDTIALPNRRVLWLIFVPKRQEAPVPVQSNGPQTGPGRYLVGRNDYYVRVGDEVRKCIDPADFERLFRGARSGHMQAYAYEVDEPYFRLLTPHCQHFIGRSRLLLEVQEALLHTRHPVIALDGSGGVGKTALAIEVMRGLYDMKSHMFLISNSAKTKVWHGYTSSRQAGFSGFTEYLQELAKVLQVPPDPNIDRLKAEVLAAMDGNEGVLLVDNMEEIQDPELARFLSREVPAPVKVLVTSRVDKGLGALTISVPEMQEDEARELLFHELERVGYSGYRSEGPQLQEILVATGRLPLALKWAAGVALSYGSLKEASRRLRANDSSKREFMHFCFATMYDTLSPLARQLAMLCCYLGEEWNLPTACVALDQPDSEVTRAFDELKSRGILAASGSWEGASMLPLTGDFLTGKWNEDDALRHKVNARLAEALGTEAEEGLLLNWPEERRIEVLQRRALELLGSAPDRALRLVRLAQRWSAGADLSFVEGQCIFEMGQRAQGLSLMRVALARGPQRAGRSSEEHFYFAQSLLAYGGRQGQREALQILEQALPQAVGVTPERLRAFLQVALECREYRSIRYLLDKTKHPQYLHWMLQDLWPQMQDGGAVVHACRTALLRALRLASKSSELPEGVRTLYADRLGQMTAGAHNSG
ncbi:ATP-binding protein [bacterium]|nr:ATP-binding protein [bacterium]